MNFDLFNFSWFWVAFLGYFLVALEVVLDKFLLSSKKVSHPAVFAFYSAVLSLFVVVFWLTGQVHKVTLDFLALSILCGAVFVYGIFCLFFALRSGEAGRAIPVSGAVMPVMVALLSLFFLQERLNTFHWLGIFLLILGGLLISLEKNKKSNFFAEAKYAVLAGVLRLLRLKRLDDWQDAHEGLESGNQDVGTEASGNQGRCAG
jgi:drug/metabolite transporter (DMT)-like permease